ncbi:hypothetical protein PVK06_048209 [Gossypium arboreum]|uniref:Uncharacterized protein n=1 Tax=Gossypium arboreum TaxID=29729 RepID=A0ABR0MFN0_GOSAR|nr:hypothetical protein PVK06_048209 [Gossypium arboreum]
MPKGQAEVLGIAVVVDFANMIVRIYFMYFATVLQLESSGAILSQKKGDSSFTLVLSIIG